LSGTPPRPTATTSGITFFNLFKNYNIIGITCEISGTRNYVLYNLIPGTPTSPVADTFTVATVAAATTAVYMSPTFSVNIYNLALSDVTAFYAGEIVQLNITCNAVPATTALVTTVLSVIPTIDQVVSTKLVMTATLTQATTPAALLTLLQTAPSLRTCTVGGYRPSGTVYATLAISVVGVPISITRTAGTLTLMIADANCDTATCLNKNV
jgi:hypothetical protein